VAPARAAAPYAPPDSSAAPERPATSDGGGIAGKTWSYFTTLGQDLVTQAGYPYRVARDEPWRFAAGAAGLATLIITDPITEDWLLPESMKGSDFQQHAQDYCDIVTTKNAAIFVAGFGAAGIFSDRELDTAVLLSRAFITTTVWTGALKVLTGRQRPRETTGYHSDWTGPGGIWADPGDDTKYRSFPSGHASNMWTMAAVLAHQYPSHHVVPVASYTAAAAMSYARIVVDAHWLSDVVVAGFIGYGCARQVIASHDARRAEPQSQTGWHLNLDVDGDRSGVSLVYGF